VAGKPSITPPHFLLIGGKTMKIRSVEIYRNKNNEITIFQPCFTAGSPDEKDYDQADAE